VQQTRGGRLRASAARTYLRPAMARPNLRVITGAMVRRVVFEGRRAVGVEFERGGVTERAEAAVEVILSAGAIGSPHLLQLSGVGDPGHLGRVGLPVHHALRGVGRGFQDHFLVRVQAEVRDIATLNERSRGIRFAGEVLKYLANGTGMLTYAASLLAASVKVLPESATPDVQALFASASYAPGTRDLDTRPGMTSGVWQMRPESRGHVLARSPDPRDQPSINPNYLAEDRDRRTLLAGMRLVRAWFNAPALRRYLVAETLPGPELQTDEELLAFARQAGTTVFHASCSCRMGPDAMAAVVDDRLRVHGLEGLRVIDASVMPAVTSTNTNAPTIMIAEKGAEMVKQAARERPTAAVAA
jgi:choline dehydrogenase